MPLCVRLITHPPRPYLPDPFIQLQSVMYLWYSVCCTGCCSCLAHMLLFLVQKFDKWQQVCTDLKKIPNHSHPTHLSHLICCSLPVLSCCSEIFFFFFLTDPGCEFSWGLQLRSGRPDLPGIHGQRPVVLWASRYHIRWWAEELPRQVSDVFTNPSLMITLRKGTGTPELLGHL